MPPPRKRRILYVGNPKPGETSLYRLHSLERLRQDVQPFDVSAYQPASRFLRMARQRMPVGPLIARINRELLQKVRAYKPDVVWFDKPLHFTRSTIEAIKSAGALTVCYNQDNPFGPRNDPGWYQFYRVYRLFDLHCLFRHADVVRYQRWGLPFIETMFSFDPAMNTPPPGDWTDASRTRSVSYIGSPYEERPEFLTRLGGLEGIRLTISGPRWDRVLSPDLYVRYGSPGYLADSAYREAIWSSRINLSFVTRLNEDDIGHKSVEIAACQGFLLAVRSEGHLGLFEEDQEAVFFSSVEECADKCRFYLNRPDLREEIARRGRERAVGSGYDNDTQLSRILNRLDGQG